MFCPSCGSAVVPTARFCPNCGAAVPAPPPAAATDQSAQQPQRKWSAGKVILLGCGLLVLIGIGIAVAAFFGIRYALKSSDAAKVAVQALKESSAARQVLGEINDVGTPMGSISSEIGGSGSATLSMSVTGTKASGKYYATLQRRNGQWMLISGRVELADGRSINVETVTPVFQLSLTMHDGRHRLVDES